MNSIAMNSSGLAVEEAGLRALWHNAGRVSALFERESAPVAQWIRALTSDYPDALC
jgi:hypothetical protein